MGTEQKEELDITTHELHELIRDKDDDIDHKNDQIQQLNNRMNEMSAEFASMLSETLELMRSHISEKLAQGAGEDAGSSDFAQRLQDYSVKAYNAVQVSTRTGAQA